MIVMKIIELLSNPMSKSSFLLFVLLYFLEPVVQRILIYCRSFKKNMYNWNLFASIDKSPSTIRYQRLSTRLYLCLLVGKLLYTFFFFTILI